MSLINYILFLGDQVGLDQYNQCSKKIKEIKDELIHDMLRYCDRRSTGKNVQRGLTYRIKFCIDNRIYLTTFEVSEIEKHTFEGKTVIREAECNGEILESNINIFFSSEYMEKNQLDIDGWLVYNGTKYECRQSLIFDCSYNGRLKTYGFPIMASYDSSFVDPVGKKMCVTIDVVSIIIDNLHIMNFYNELEDEYSKSEVFFNSVSTGWHKFFGQYRYISPLSFSTISDSFFLNKKLLKVDQMKTCIGRALEIICMTDYNTLLFCYSLYTIGKSFLHQTKKYPVALNILTDTYNHDEAIKIARQVLYPISPVYSEENAEIFCNNSNFYPKKYLKMSCPDFFRKDISSKISFGRFRDIAVVSSGKHVANRYNKRPEYETCTISDSMLQKKITSERTHVFFNIENHCTNLISYKPCSDDIGICRTDSDFESIKDISELLIKNMILFMEKDINEWKLYINKKKLKELHEKIVNEINFKEFEDFTQKLIKLAIKDISDKDDFWQKVKYQNVKEIYNSKLITNGYNSNIDITPDILEQLNKMIDIFLDNVYDNCEHRGRDLLIFGQIIDDIGYRLFYNDDTDNFSNVDRDEQHKRVQEIIKNEYESDNVLYEMAHYWYLEHLKELLTKLLTYTEIGVPKKFGELSKESYRILKEKSGLSAESCKNLQNFFAMSLYFKEFISKEHPQCSELCDKMLERLLNIFKNNESQNKCLTDVNSTAMILGEFLYESGKLSLLETGDEKNNTPLYYSDGKSGLRKETAGIYKSRDKMLCYFNSGDAMETAFKNYLSVKGYTTDISIKRCISDVFVPEKIVCTYKSRFSCEVTVDKKSQYAYKIYMDKLKHFCNIPDDYKPLSISDDIYTPLSLSDII